MNVLEGILADIKRITRRLDRIESRSSKMIVSGAGDPDGVYAAPVGSLYLRTDGGANTTLYVKEVGTDHHGWAAK